MAVTNKMMIEEIQRLQLRINEITAIISLLCERVAGTEKWQNGHNKDVHPRLREQIAAAQRVQEKQSDRLWEIALKVANLVALLATMTKLANVW